MAKLSMKLKQQAEPKFSTRRYNRCKICGRPTLTCVTMVSAVSASVSWLTRARSPASGRLPGNPNGIAGPDAPTIRPAFPYSPVSGFSPGTPSPASGNRSVPVRTDTLPPIQALPVIL